MTQQYGLIGFPLSHSFSPSFFQAKFEAEGIDASFSLFPLSSIDQFPALLARTPGLLGLSVTIPYKTAIFPFLDNIDPTAQIIGAVNCVALRDGATTGYNTDVIGFERSLLPLLRSHHHHALVLGSGGASKAVTFVLRKLGIASQIVSRAGAEGVLRYEDVTPELMAANKLIVNTTPLGMFPAVDAAPQLPYAAIGPDHLLYDLVYNPLETKFLSVGKAHGSIIKNGLEMLHLQALAAWALWQKR